MFNYERWSLESLFYSARFTFLDKQKTNVIIANFNF